jgi:hypothetical protein
MIHAVRKAIDFCGDATVIVATVVVVVLTGHSLVTWMLLE